MAKKQAIEPQRWYTLQEIVEQRMLPWIQPSYWSVRRVVLSARAKKVLRPVTMGKGTNVRYQFKGENIVKFIKAVETGEVRL